MEFAVFQMLVTVSSSAKASEDV